MGTEVSGGRTGEQGRPSRGDCSYGCGPQRTRHSTGPAASEEAHEFFPSRTAEAARLLREQPTYRESQTWSVHVRHLFWNYTGTAAKDGCSLRLQLAQEVLRCCSWFKKSRRKSLRVHTVPAAGTRHRKSSGADCGCSCFRESPGGTVAVAS